MPFSGVRISAGWLLHGDTRPGGITEHIQWNPYIVDTIGELRVGRYRGLAVAEGVYKYYMIEIRT